MKRVSILAVIITMLGMGLGSCTSLSRKSELKTDIDTMSYFIGMSRADGIINHLLYSAGVDTSYMDAFYKGFKDGAKNYSPADVAYLEGRRIAHMINNSWVESLNMDVFMGDSTMTINRWAMLAGFYNGVRNQDDMRIMNAQSFGQMKLEMVKDTYRKKKFAESIAASEKLLADNRNKPEIKTTSSGLQYKIITEGTGPVPNENSRIKVHYRGTLVDGTEFDSSLKNETPASFHIYGVIKGWTEALLMMPVGSKWELYIPQDLAYGSMGQLPKIPPYATLIFELELVEIEK